MIQEIIKDKDIERLNDIYRWSFYKVHKHENIPQHSYWVIFFSDLLIEQLCNEADDELVVLQFKLRVLKYATYHDLDEIFTGDVSHEVKSDEFYGRQIKESLKLLAYKSMVNKFMSEDDFGINILNSTIYKDELASSVVKLADWLSFIKFAYNETILGNSQFVPILQYCTKKCVEQCDICFDSLVKYSEKTDIKFNFKILQEIKTLKW